MMERLSRNHAAIGVAFCFAILTSTFARAGIGPENLVVVVNARSTISRTIANHYVALRGIPQSNVILLNDVPDGLKVNLDDFKSKILNPLLAEIDARKIAGQVRVIAYSADFPTSVDIAAHTAKLTDDSLKKYQLPTASINGLTMLYQFVLSDSANYLDWGSNLYARGGMDRHFRNPFSNPDRRKRFDDAAAKVDENVTGKDYSAAATEFSALFDLSPGCAPLAILAAEAYASADDRKLASEMIAKAIRSGWQSATYLDRSESLGPIFADDNFKKIREVLTDAPAVAQDPIGFSGDVAWMANGWPTSDAADGIRYLPSCMLAVVHQRGSTVEQAVAGLKRSVSGDQSFPDAAVWFSRTGDVRTTTRFEPVTDAMLWLGHLHRRVEVFRTPIPTDRGDCVGLMLGTPTTPLAGKPFELVPGSIADNLTSLGAVFDSDSQSKLTDLLHAGAAISSGAVYEPFSLAFKFPTAMMYGYYASGVTAIEAFYSTVTSPYQLLIVGDPLAQAYARVPTDQVRISVIDSLLGEKKLRIERKPPTKLDETKSTNVAMIELFVDGKLLRRIPPVPRIEVNVNGGPAGVVEVRVAMIGRDATQPRISQARWLNLSNKSLSPVAELSPDKTMIRAKCAGAEKIEYVLYGEVIATTMGAEGEMTPDRIIVGDGPLTIQPVAIIGGDRIPGRPITFGEI